MDKTLKTDEKLYRAVYPPEVRDMYWKNNGEVSSAAFYDTRGCSVDRGNYRTDDEVVRDMQRRFSGRIVAVTVGICVEVGAKVVYKPSENIFHSEIHGSDSKIVLNKSQRKCIARNAKVVAL